MNVQSHLEVLRLHGGHLRTLVDRIISEIITIEQIHATDGNTSVAIPVPQLDVLGKQSEYIAKEARRLQEFMRSLARESTGASDAGVETQPSSSPPSDIPKQ
jgi:hypothetical protein